MVGGQSPLHGGNGGSTGGFGGAGYGGGGYSGGAGLTLFSPGVIQSGGGGGSFCLPGLAQCATSYNSNVAGAQGWASITLIG